MAGLATATVSRLGAAEITVVNRTLAKAQRLAAEYAATAAPLGDLCQSLVKRDLDVKDMGTILPGHGGFLDRFDGLLFVLPVVYYLARILLY